MKALTIASCFLFISLTQAELPLSAVAADTQWCIDKRSSILVTTKTGAHLRAECRFRNLAGTFLYDSSKESGSNLVVRIPIDSLETGIAVRDDDLKGSGYFEMSKFPNAVFTCKKLVKQSSGAYLLKGNLSLHGLARNVDLTVPPTGFVQTSKSLEAIGTAVIDQKEFNLSLHKLHPDGKAWINKAIVIKVNLLAKPAIRK